MPVGSKTSYKEKQHSLNNCMQFDANRDTQSLVPGQKFWLPQNVDKKMREENSMNSHYFPTFFSH